VSTHQTRQHACCSTGTTTTLHRRARTFAEALVVAHYLNRVVVDYGPCLRVPLHVRARFPLNRRGADTVEATADGEGEHRDAHQATHARAASGEVVETTATTTRAPTTAEVLCTRTEAIVARRATASTAANRHLGRSLRHREPTRTGATIDVRASVCVCGTGAA